MIFVSTDKNKEALENYTELWDKTKDQIELRSGNKPTEYKNDFMKIRFDSGDNLPLVKILNIPACTKQELLSTSFLHEYFYECEYEYEDDCYSIVYMIPFQNYYKKVCMSMKTSFNESKFHQLHKVSFIYCFSFSFFGQNLNIQAFLCINYIKFLLSVVFIYFFFSDKISIFRLFYLSVT